MFHSNRLDVNILLGTITAAMFLLVAWTFRSQAWLAGLLLFLAAIRTLILVRQVLVRRERIRRRKELEALEEKEDPEV